MAAFFPLLPRRGKGRSSPLVRLFCFFLCTAAAAPLLAESLSFQDALSLALNNAPQLKATAAQVDAAMQAAIPASELPDPKLAFGVENLPVEGADRFQLSQDFMTMQRFGVMQEFPNTAKREARRDAAEARVELARVMAQLRRQTVLRETALAWINRHFLEQQVQLLEALAAENRLFEAAVHAQLVGGKSAATDTVLPRQEAAMLASRHDELQAKITQANAQLRRWLGVSADAPLSGEPAEWTFRYDELQQQLRRHPDVHLFSAQARLIDAEWSEAVAAKQPDWAVEFAYLRRGEEFGDMIMLQFSMDLPLFSGSRQQPVIASKSAERVALAAEREAILREHEAALASDFAEYQRLQQAEARFGQQHLPLAAERVSLAVAAWKAGKGALIEVVASRREQLETRLAAIETRARRQQLAARLQYDYVEPAQAWQGAQP